MSKAQETAKRMDILRNYQYKKTLYERTRPYLLNFVDYTVKELINLGINIHCDLDAEVIDLLSDGEIQKTQILSFSGTVGSEMIDIIKCPTCDKKLYRHKYWDCYICLTKDGNGIVIGKEIFDILKVTCEKLQAYEKELDELRAVKIKESRNKR